MATDAKAANKETTRQDSNWAAYRRLQQLGILKESVSGQSKISIPMPLDGEASLKLELAESKRRFEEIKAEAERNQKYYCDLAAKSGGKKLWFEFPKSDKVYSEYVLVSPDMAESALTKNLTNPRKPKPKTIDQYARDMKAGRWLPTSESVDLDYNLEWYNGRHRFNAITVAGIPVILYISWNNLVEARFGQDQGIVRSISEKMSMVMTNNVGTKLPAVARAMMRGLTNSGVKFSHAEVTQFAVIHGPIIEWVVKTCPGVRADVQAVFAKAALFYGVDKIEPFAKRVANVMFKSTNDPARRLYEFLGQSKKRGGIALMVYKKALAAIHHFVNNREPKALCERDWDVFEWGPNWSVPPKSQTQVKDDLNQDS